MSGLTVQQLLCFPGFLLLVEAILFLGLGLAAPVKVVDYHANEHINDEEAHDEQVDDKERRHVLVVVLDGLLVDAHGVDAVVHGVHPAVFGGNYEQGE